MQLLLLFTLMLLFLVTAPTTEKALPQVYSARLPGTSRQPPDVFDARDYEGFAGRLYVDEVSINVALYRGNSQEVVDREDSAAYFDLSYARGNMIIADHNSDAFGALGSVREGTVASLERADGSEEYYTCTAVFRGHNTGKGITDWNGVSVVGKAELMMYTCFDGWQNVWVVLWARTSAPADDHDLGLIHHVIHTIQQLLDQLHASDRPLRPDSERNKTELE